MGKYIKLKDLEVYKLARKASKLGWAIYEELSWQEKKIIGDQFIEALDSIGANIAEGYGRYHYLDRVKFYYNSRASLLETRHWINLLLERKIGSKDKLKKLNNLLKKVHFKLNRFIKSTRKNK